MPFDIDKLRPTRVYIDIRVKLISYTREVHKNNIYRCSNTFLRTARLLIRGSRASRLFQNVNSFLRSLNGRASYLGYFRRLWDDDDSFIVISCSGIVLCRSWVWCGCLFWDSYKKLVWCWCLLFKVQFIREWFFLNIKLWVYILVCDWDMSKIRMKIGFLT